MPRHQKSVVVSNTDLTALDDPVGITDPDRNILAELGHPADEVEGVRLITIVSKPEMDAVLLIVEHEEYEEVADLAEAPRVKIGDPMLSRPSKRKVVKKP
jgi:hypothetical protein